MTRYRYAAFGLAIESDLALPELMPSAEDRPPDVTIRLAPELAAMARTTDVLRVTGSAARLSIDKVGCYDIADGTSIAVAPIAGASARNVRLFLLGSAFGLLCHQRGLVPLNANALVWRGAAVAFAGRSGIGKSTLATYFASQGLDVLCDDVCVLDFAPDGSPRAWPGLRRMKLWRDATEKFGYDAASLDRVFDDIEKFQVPLTAAAIEGPVPLKHVFVLRDRAEGEDGTIVRYEGVAAFSALRANIYRGRFLQRLGLEATAFARIAAMASRLSVYDAPRRRGFDIFESEAHRFLDFLGGETPAASA